MGLDMYLDAERYISGYEFSPEKERNEYSQLTEITGLAGAIDPHTPSGRVSMTVAYWRKSNQIHKWFVENCQNGEDDCRRAYVEREQLEELRDLCAEVLERSVLVDGVVSNGQTYSSEGGWEDITAPGKVIEDSAVAQELLPTQSGFFFGHTEYDQYYYQDLKDTVEQLTRVLEESPENVDFYYRSSW